MLVGLFRYRKSRICYVNKTSHILEYLGPSMHDFDSTGKKHFTKNGCDEGALQKKIRLKPPFHEAELQIKENE